MGGTRGWLPLRRRLPLVLILLAMGLAGIGVAQAYQAHRSHQATAEALLRDYGVFAARSFVQAWWGTLDRSLTATLSEARGAALRQNTTEQCLDTLLGSGEETSETGECDCGPAVPLVGDDAWAFHLTLGEGTLEPLLGGRPPPRLHAEAVLDSLVHFVRSQPTLPGEALRWVRGPGHRSRLFAFSALRAFSGDTVVYGVEADPARLSATLESALDVEQLLPRALTKGRSPRELLAVRLVVPGGVEVWRSSSGMGPGLEGAQPVASRMGGGVIRASVLPDAAETLVIGGLPGNRVPLLLLVFGLAGALALLAVLQMRKEEAFARQRHDFVAGVSHELRTPLAQIRLFVETLRLGRARTEEDREWALGNIDRETLRLVRLVENILLFSRAERGALEALDREPADLAEEARSVVDSFTPLLRPHEAEIRMEIPSGLVAEIHRDAFHQVLLNFLDNAVKYGPRGQVVRLAGVATDRSVRITVEDRGPGVPEEERDRIWESFRRGKDAVGSVATGSGIGLSVVRGIVEAHDGEVWVEEREDGAGARFVVEFPRARTATSTHLEERRVAEGEVLPSDGGASDDGASDGALGVA